MKEKSNVFALFLDGLLLFFLQLVDTLCEWRWKVKITAYGE